MCLGSLSGRTEVIFQTDRTDVVLCKSSDCWCGFGAARNGGGGALWTGLELVLRREEKDVSRSREADVSVSGGGSNCTVINVWKVKLKLLCTITVSKKYVNSSFRSTHKCTLFKLNNYLSLINVIRDALSSAFHQSDSYFHRQPQITQQNLLGLKLVQDSARLTAGFVRKSRLPVQEKPPRLLCHS